MLWYKTANPAFLSPQKWSPKYDILYTSDRGKQGDSVMTAGQSAVTALGSGQQEMLKSSKTCPGDGGEQVVEGTDFHIP